MSYDAEDAVGDNSLDNVGVSTARSVVKNTGVLSLGQVVSLALGLVFTALLSRHIGPEGYGQYVFAHSVIAVLMLFVNLGFNGLAIRNVAQEKEQASKYFTNIVFVKILLAVIAFSFFLPVVLLKGHLGQISVLVLLVGVSAVLESLILAAGAIFFAFEKMEYDVSTQVVRAVVALGLGAGAIFLGYTLTQIVAILISANIIRAVLSFALLSTRIVRPKPEIDIGFCRKIIVDSIPFALLVFVPVVLANVNVLMLGALKNDTVVGWYGSALRILSMLLIVSGMLQQSIYPVLSKFYTSSTRSLALSYRKSYEWGLILGLPMAAGIFLVADQVISLVFGPGFENASDILRLLSFVIAVGFCNNVNGATMNAMRRERLFAALSTGSVLAVVALNWLLIPRFSYVGVAITYNIGTGLGFVVYSVLCHRWLKLGLPWKTGIRAALATLLMGTCVHYSLDRGISFLATLIIGPAVYGGALYLLRAFSSEDLALFKRVLSLA